MPTTPRNLTLAAGLVLAFGIGCAHTEPKSQPASSPTAISTTAKTITVMPDADLTAGSGGGRGARGGRGGGAMPGVYKASVNPNWFDNNTKFWYRNALRGGASEFILVDADKGLRQKAFDHDRLAASLTKSLDKPIKGDHLPFTSLEFVSDGKAIKFDASDKSWTCDLGTYVCTPGAATGDKQSSADSGQKVTLSTESADATDLIAADGNTSDDLESAPSLASDENAAPFQQDQQAGQQQGQAQGQGRRGGRGGAGGRGGGRGGGRAGGGGGGFGGFGGAREVNSRDGKWTAFLTNFNVSIRPAGGGEAVQLSTDGVTNNAYGGLSWAPDSSTIIAWRIEPGDNGQVYWIMSNPEPPGRAVMSQQGYPQAGDKMTAYELNLFSVETHKQIKPAVDRVDFGSPMRALRWRKDGQHFSYEKEDRGHTRFRVIDVDPHTGEVRNIIDDQPKTFIWNMNTDAFRGQLRITTYLPDTDEIIYESEQDGWRHLYLYDVKEAKLKNQITKGQWLVRGIDQIDEAKRQIWFEANGLFPNQDPYYIHKCRINFDGTGFTALTEGNGTHDVVYSPDKHYIIDTYSRLNDLPPVNELRRVSDGKLVCKLEEADISQLKATNWVGTETFVAKGRDGTTDIYGTIERPPNFDPNKKYPILEDIYAGPQGSTGTTVPTAFTTGSSHANYTRAGIIVVKIDGMGTPNRSKAFHDVCWHNLADAGFPDRILWMQAAAKKYPYMDTNRVGIYGTSAGGQNAAGAVIFHPEWYKVAVANCGCHDNRIDKSTWNEQWMGFMPHDKIWSKDDDNWFAKSSNVDNAGRLGGKLFLIVGEQDHNVPPDSTFRVVNELIRAGKDFDLLVVPGADHGASSPVNSRYTSARTQDYLVRNLVGGELATRNNHTKRTN